MKVDPGTRRRFLGQVAGISALALAGSDKGLCGSFDAGSDHKGIAYVTQMPHDKLLSFAIQGSRWRHVASIATKSPAFVVAHPTVPFVYVLNAVNEHDGLPRGTVEAFATEPDGGMRFVNRQTLSLSAVDPRHAVVSPDGKHLIVAVYGGGAYNVLRIQPDGRVGAVTDIRKELGCGPNRAWQSSAHPHTLAFDGSGQYLFASDLGADRISVFCLHGDQLQRIAQLSVPPGSGPGKMFVHPTEPVLSVVRELNGSIASYKWKPEEKTLQEIQLRPGAYLKLGMQQQFGSAAAAAHRDTVYAIGADLTTVTGHEILPPTRSRIIARVPNATAIALRLVS